MAKAIKKEENHFSFFSKKREVIIREREWGRGKKNDEDSEQCCGWRGSRRSHSFGFLTTLLLPFVQDVDAAFMNKVELQAKVDGLTDEINF